MGMFDIVTLKCPECNVINEEQSKSGSCNLITYDIYDAPLALLADLQDCSPIECENCGHIITIRVQYVITIT